MYPYARYSKLGLALKLTLRRRYLDQVMTRMKSSLVRYMQLQNLSCLVKLDQKILGSSGLEVDLQIEKGM